MTFLSIITRNGGVKPITEALPDPQVHRYTVVAFHLESKGIVIYIFPKNGSGKGIVLNINHYIMPQTIGRALTRVSHDKEISKHNTTQHTTTPKEKGIKERKNKRTN